jgi:hypothetical protein
LVSYQNTKRNHNPEALGLNFHRCETSNLSLLIHFATESFRLAKSLTSCAKFWTISVDPEQPVRKAVDPVIKRSYNKFGIFLDYDCPEGKEYLQEVSPKTLPNYASFSDTPI